MPTKSGTFWVTWADSHAKNSDSVDDLVEPFRSNTKSFIKALKDAGATVIVSTTRRSDKRAYLFHSSWKISQGKCKASDPPTLAGVDIQWDHGTEPESKRGALEMVDGFGLAVAPQSINPPSLTSHHITGNAVDMTIKWAGTISIKERAETTVAVPFMSNVNLNSALHGVGDSYGVKKLNTDAPHWSIDGH